MNAKLLRDQIASPDREGPSSLSARRKRATEPYLSLETNYKMKLSHFFPSQTSL